MDGLVLFVVVLGGVMLWKWQQISAVNTAWNKAASSLGLSFKPGGLMTEPLISGLIDDMAIDISVFSNGSGNSRTYYTRYRVGHRPVGPPVRLKKQGSFSFMGRLVGKRDVVIGDPFFDDRVVVDSHAPDAIRSFLTPSRRAAVLDLLSVWPSGEFTHESVEVSAKNREKNPNRMENTLYRVIDTAKAMGEDSLDAILGHQQQGELGLAADELHTLNQTRPNIFTEILEGEALVELGRHEEAAVVFDGLGQRLPEDPSIREWQGLSHLPPPPTMPSVPAAVPQVGAVPERVDAPITVDLGQQSVVDDLFAANRMSWEIVEYFEATYQNATVEWTGEVTQFHTYRHDTDFGAGPGIKATVLLGQAGESDFISNEVHAIVQLPEGAVIERGTQVQFRGLLTHVDRFARKVFIERAVPLS